MLNQFGSIGGNFMIDVTKLDGTIITINADYIYYISENPDTVITFKDGKKIIVKESRQEIKSLVELYKISIK